MWEAYKKAIEINKTAINPYVNLANIQLYTQDDADAAIDTYKQALRAIPYNNDFETLLAVAYEQKGDKESAKNTYQNILSRDAENKAAQAGLGQGFALRQLQSSGGHARPDAARVRLGLYQLARCTRHQGLGRIGIAHDTLVEGWALIVREKRLAAQGVVSHILNPVLGKMVLMALRAKPAAQCFCVLTAPPMLP